MAGTALAGDMLSALVEMDAKKDLLKADARPRCAMEGACSSASLFDCLLATQKAEAIDVVKMQLGNLQDDQARLFIEAVCSLKLSP